MLKAEWDTCIDPEAMLRFVGNYAGVRECQLFAVACCRRIGSVMTDPACRAAVDAVEH